MALRVYNTLTRQKEPFKEPGKVSMYVCGPTVYKPSHVGHMVGPVIFDTVKRYLMFLSYQVTFVVNITDIDDKIIAEAQKQKRDWKELAESVTRDYRCNLQELNVTNIDHFPRATEHIADILTMIGGLIEKGYAYPAAGDVYFDVTRDSDYGKLCNRDPEQMEAGARIEVSEKKRNPGDFALWKGAKPGEPKWDSPWGPGRPGWHIECSAMSMKLLGQTIDIHGGGLDLQFPHHENELAQSESYNDKPFVRYWMHNGLMRIGGAKISKTHEEEQKKKATLVVGEVLQKHAAETVRFLLLSTHYRSPIEWSEERLGEVARALEAFYRFFERYERITGTSFYQLPVAATRPRDADTLSVQIAPPAMAFMDAMNDDFNTGGAVGALFELVNTLNRSADQAKLESPGAREKDLEDFRRGVLMLRQLSHILGLFREAPKKAEGGSELVGQLVQLLSDLHHEDKIGDKALETLMQQLINLRNESRKSKNFAVADQIRKRLTAIGVTLEDRPGGTGWRVG
jgi:cysteinyl-tRNA synthetase